MVGIAHAAGQAGGAGAMGLGEIVPFILIFVVMYFLIIRPQQAKTKAHQNFVTNMKKYINLFL